MSHSTGTARHGARKVVAHVIGGELIKGYLDAPSAADLHTAVREHLHGNGSRVPILDPGLEQPTHVGLDSLKALFFVKSFEGRKDYDEVKFFSSHPVVEGLWVQVTFADGEVTEGILQNSISYIVDPGFLLKPPDPHSNNEYVYVLKKSLKEFRILGVRESY